MTFMEVKPTAFLIEEEGFNTEAFFVPMAGFVGQVEIGDQVDGFDIPLLPPGDHRHGAIAFFGKPNVGNADHIVGLNEQVIRRKRMILFVQLGILRGAAHILPVHGLQGRLQFDAIEFPIAQEDGLRVHGQNILQLA